MAGEMMALAGANDAHDDIKDTIFWQMNRNENRFQQQQAMRNQMRLNSQMARLARVQRMNAAYDEVHGLEMAGLSPVLAGGEVSRLLVLQVLVLLCPLLCRIFLILLLVVWLWMNVSLVLSSSNG